MKAILLFLSFSLTISTVFAKSITVNVVFENRTQNENVTGTFYVSGTNQQLDIYSLEKFTVDVPTKGKYEFRFHTDDALAFTSYPARINNDKNTVTIILEKKKEKAELTTPYKRSPLLDITNLSTERLEAGINEGAINFIIHSLIAPNPESVQAFKDQYGIGFIIENCAVDAVSFKTATRINKKIEAFLNLKYGENWQDLLPMTPFGL